MKRIVILLALVTLSVSARSQSATISSSADDGNLYQYIAGFSDFYSGQGFSFGGDIVQDEDGNPLPFYFWISCINYMTLQGWELVNFSLNKDNLNRRSYTFRRRVSQEEARTILNEKPLSPCTHPAPGTAPFDEDNLYLYAVGFATSYEFSDKPRIWVFDKTQKIWAYVFRNGDSHQFYGNYEKDYPVLLKDEEGNVIDSDDTYTFINYLSLQGWSYLGEYDHSLYRRKVSTKEARTLIKKMIRQEE